MTTHVDPIDLHNAVSGPPLMKEEARERLTTDVEDEDEDSYECYDEDDDDDDDGDWEDDDQEERTIDVGDFWDAIDILRGESGVTLDELARGCGITRSCLQKRRERKSGTERLNECAELFAALGWKMKITIERYS